MITFLKMLSHFWKWLQDDSEEESGNIALVVILNCLGHIKPYKHAILLDSGELFHSHNVELFSKLP